MAEAPEELARGTADIFAPSPRITATNDGIVILFRQNDTRAFKKETMFKTALFSNPQQMGKRCR
jgi:hypothetical protein